MASTPGPSCTRSGRSGRVGPTVALRRAATSSGFSGVVYNRILPKVVLGRRLPSHTVFECPTPRVSAHSYIRLYSSCSTTPYSWSSAEEAAHWSAPSCSVRAITNSCLAASPCNSNPHNSSGTALCAGLGRRVWRPQPRAREARLTLRYGEPEGHKKTRGPVDTIQRISGGTLRTPEHTRMVHA